MARHMRQTDRDLPMIEAMLPVVWQRLTSAAGLALMLLGTMVLLAIVSYNPADPSLNRALDGPVTNILGLAGAYLSDLLLQTLGVASALLGFGLGIWGWRLMARGQISQVWLRVAALLSAMLLAATACAALPPSATWPVESGLGGVAGLLVLVKLGGLLHALFGQTGLDMMALFAAALALLLCLYAVEIGTRDVLIRLRRALRWGLTSLGDLRHLGRHSMVAGQQAAKISRKAAGEAFAYAEEQWQRHRDHDPALEAELDAALQPSPRWHLPATDRARANAARLAEMDDDIGLFVPPLPATEPSLERESPTPEPVAAPRRNAEDRRTEDRTRTEEMREWEGEAMAPADDAARVDPQAVDPRAVDPQALDPQALDPRAVDPRADAPEPMTQKQETGGEDEDAGDTDSLDIDASAQAYHRAYVAAGYAGACDYTLARIGALAPHSEGETLGAESIDSSLEPATTDEDEDEDEIIYDALFDTPSETEAANAHDHDDEAIDEEEDGEWDDGEWDDGHSADNQESEPDLLPLPGSDQSWDRFDHTHRLMSYAGIEYPEDGSIHGESIHEAGEHDPEQETRTGEEPLENGTDVVAEPPLRPTEVAMPYRPESLRRAPPRPEPADPTQDLPPESHIHGSAAMPAAMEDGSEARAVAHRAQDNAPALDPAHRAPVAPHPPAPTASAGQPTTAVAAAPSPTGSVVDAPRKRVVSVEELVPNRKALPAIFQMPAPDLLKAPQSPALSQEETEQALSQRAGELMTVLQDFGVRGEIVKVRPGPVVTLYELEPAPGTKSSRVISLADDIARSMSAISVRIAVVPGRNVIGIELPNRKRETVYLRELLASPAFDEAGIKLPLLLGKDISGIPVVADLARMPHLLVAGTTGSGKSVAINAMILSLIYRLPPDRCRFIMVDPKMLELSVYNHIPHLLTPVVTDPGKAVVALKWAVREMEDRYKKMSQLGVRNMESYNARISEAKRDGEVLTRRVQTGFDPETGCPVYEEQRLDLDTLPFIVVVVDEMADLMLVAGKDIEAAIQRLAQMARAAGIHLIMATQRPSVDVITGTIKANFPTRISFNVTSKIDSRTILGEQGAEQLLGQGDMLYMAGGGRLTRVHGPFVSDQEVEKVVEFLKSQGGPAYIDGLTEEEEESASGEDGGKGSKGIGDELYDQAVELVRRERKASTSFIQRHLQIGYNRAARIIESMEEDGIVSPANHVGKREVLAPRLEEEECTESAA